MKTTLNKRVSGSYLNLIRRFPLHPFRNERKYDAAVEVMNKLAVGDEGTLDPGEKDYFDTLTVLVEAYDREHFEIDTSHITPLELLKYAMENRGMSVSDLGRVLGSQPLASMILAGHRGISRAKARLLGAHFGLDPSAFL